MNDREMNRSMQSNGHGKGKNPAMTFVMGAVVGGVAAVLLAPDRGENTRKRLKDGARHIYKAGADAVMEAKDAVQEKAGTITDAMQGKVEDASESAGHQVDAMKNAMRSGKTAYREELKKSSV